jgi:predicted MFS family arabinose efflux permease
MITLVQLIVTDEMRGRVMSVYNLAFRGGMPMGSLVLGRLMPRFGVSLTIACAGSLLVLLSLYFLLVQRRVAALQTPVAAGETLTTAEAAKEASAPKVIS